MGWAVEHRGLLHPGRKPRGKRQVPSRAGLDGVRTFKHSYLDFTPRFGKEVEKTAEKLQIKEYIKIFQSRQQGSSDGRSIIGRGWDLERIHKKYASFIGQYRPRLEDHLRRLKAGESIEPSECFVERFKLIDEYRRLPFFDPNLPEELLPANWLRSEARDLFNEYHNLLTRKANEYFDSVLKAY